MTSLVDECTLDLVQTPDGSVVFSDAGGIYRLALAAHDRKRSERA